ncbi:hypothetical protein DID80_04795 [Candidatus Marinamargulisbacteria bacterium SCGC AAA071-K20]|nr:hypothetical protein DID80_04795 [Candidatus Marinamargulisbacteria bacterium SCGC AAA071-K20]
MGPINSLDNSERVRKKKKKKSGKGVFPFAFDDNLLNATEAIEADSVVDSKVATKDGYEKALSLTEKLEQYLLDN